MMVDSISRGYFETPQDIFDRFEKELKISLYFSVLIVPINTNSSPLSSKVLEYMFT